MTSLKRALDHWKAAKSKCQSEGRDIFLYLTAYSSPISAFCCFLHRIFSGFQHFSHSRKIWSGVPSSLLSISWSGGGATFLKLGDKLVTLTLHSPHRLTGALDFQIDCYCVKSRRNHLQEDTTWVFLEELFYRIGSRSYNAFVPN